MPNEKRKTSTAVLPADAVESYLVSNYQLDFPEAKAYASKLVREGDKNIVPAAMEKLADREKGRIEKINHYVDVAKRFYSGEPVDEDDLNYLNEVHERTRAQVQAKAQKEAATKSAVNDPLYQEAMRDRATDASFVLNNRPVSTQQKVATISSFRPGMTILDDQRGLDVPMPMQAMARRK